MAQVIMLMPYFWPEKAANIPLTTSLVEDLVKHNHVITIVAPKPYRGLSNVEIGSFNKNIYNHYKGARVIRFSIPLRGLNSLFGKIIEYVYFTIYATVFSIFVRKVDVYFVPSTPPLLGLPIGIVGKLRRKKVIYNLQDLFPDSAIAASLIKSKLLIRLLRICERGSYLYPHAVVCISDNFKKHVLNIEPKADAMVISNWVDTSIIKNIGKDDNLFIGRNKITAKFIVLYSGNIGQTQDLELIIEVAKMLFENNEIFFFIIGEGQNKMWLEKAVLDAKVENIHLFPFQPDEMIPDVYSAADICLVPMKPNSGYGSVPSKVCTIMACQKPLIVCIEEDTETADIILKYNTGLVVSPGNVFELKTAIDMLYSNPNLRCKLGRNGRALVEAKYGRDNATTEYSNLIDKLTLP